MEHSPAKKMQKNALFSSAKSVKKDVKKDLKKDKIEKAIQLSDEKYCGVMEMFRQFAEITTVIKYKEKKSS